MHVPTTLVDLVLSPFVQERQDREAYLQSELEVARAQLASFDDVVKKLGKPPSPQPQPEPLTPT